MRLKRIEFILITGIFVFTLIFIWGNRTFLSDKNASVLFLMTYSAVIYVSVLISHFWILPSFILKRKMEAGLVFSLLLFLSTWIGLGWCVSKLEYSLLQGNDWSRFLLHESSLGVTILVFLLLYVYEGTKRCIRYAKEKNRVLFAHIVTESLFVSGSIFFVLLFLLSSGSIFFALWIVASPYAYLLYALNTYWLIPLSHKKRFILAGYFSRALLLSVILFIPFGILLLTGLNAKIVFPVWLFTTAVVLPISWLGYNLQKKRIEELVNLKSELGQASADLKFLRSQINPHFLFNILNTLYGTALQEKGQRTASGIQMLGDMMRFMLHENNQDSILLIREMEYLRNYIELQCLRIVSSPEISVEYDIRDAKNETYIAPMLLIPFVENAFKHGISLQGKSWIKITLYEEDGELYFDVHNSIHRKVADDPEHANSGIGLENVRQRISLLYPDKHELVIRETPHEFFIHLTIQLREI